jgi:hypothetical protein
MILTQDQWISWGIPALFLLIAVVGYFLLRARTRTTDTAHHAVE